jgi:two-component system sensor histidine kinase KdpD
MENTQKNKGRLRIYLGYATGCGKSFTLLKDAIAQKQRKQDIAIASLNHGDRSGICDLVKEFPKIGNATHLLNVDEIIASSHDTIIIDELASTNPTGSKNAKRYDDVIEILASGKNVITTLNVQHIDSIAERLDTALSLKIQERVPDHLLTTADSVIFVDVAIDELRARIQSEQVFPKDKAEQALFNFFTYENLCLLRKLALEVTVEDQLKRIQSEKILGSNAREEADPGVLAVITDEEDLEDLYHKMIHKGARYSSQYSSHFYVVMVHPSRLIPKKKSEETSVLAKNLELLSKSMGADYQELKGPGLSEKIIDFCQSNSIRHLLFAKEKSGSFIQRAIDNTRGIDVHLIDRPGPRGEH